MVCQALLFCASLCSAGCVADVAALTGLMGQDSLVADLNQQPSGPFNRQTRAQSSDNDGKTKQEAAKDPALPPGPPDLAGPPTGAITPPEPGKRYRINVDAWVNGVPLYAEEIFFQAPQMQQQLRGLSPAEQQAKMKELVTKQRDSVIDHELMYQDAIYKLQKANPKTLDKIKKMAREDFQKQLNRVRESIKSQKIAVDEAQMREFTKLLQRKTEREFIALEYMKSRIYPKIVHMIGPPEISEYYKTHPEEFLKQETVKWQDIFISNNGRSPEETHRLAEKIMAEYKADNDFQKLLAHDDGIGKGRNGEGIGIRRGEIRPIEAEPHLFTLRDGEFGPLIEISTGVHIIRLVQRDPGGQVPFNEQVQNQIRNKLRGEVFEREIKHLIRELRGRAVIEIVPEM